MTMRTLTAATILTALATAAIAQTAPADKDAAYEKMIGDRADKYIEPLQLDDAKHAAVKTVMLDHYRYLRNWDAENGAKIKDLQADMNAATKAKDDKKVNALKEETAGVRGTRQPEHDQFIRSLIRIIPFNQVNQIKDAMTYGNLALRLGFMDKLNLTEAQHTEIRDMLVATREQAMDAGSSEEKAKMFLETVGRISLRVLTPEQNDGLKALQGKPPKRPQPRQQNPNIAQIDKKNILIGNHSAFGCGRIAPSWKPADGPDFKCACTECERVIRWYSAACR